MFVQSKNEIKLKLKLKFVCVICQHASSVGGLIRKECSIVSIDVYHIPFTNTAYKDKDIRQADDRQVS